MATGREALLPAGAAAVAGVLLLAWLVHSERRAASAAATSGPVLTMEDESARATAREYYLRDRPRLRQVFMGGLAAPVTSADLRRQFELPDWADADAMASVIEADTAGLQARLALVADEYMNVLDEALSTALRAGTTEISESDGPRPRGRKYPDEVHRIEVESGGRVHTYRIRMEATPRFARLVEESRALIGRRNRTTLETLVAITGVKPTRRSTPGPVASLAQGKSGAR